MRMRKKPNIDSRVNVCSAVYIPEPASMKGKWRSLMPAAAELRVEIGCGKGKFTVETAKQNPDILLIAVEKVPDCMVIAMEYAMRENVKNVFFVSDDAQNLCEAFDRNEVDCIYLNFCDPWPRKKNAKRRLTHHEFLERYAWILTEQGRIEFKSDNTKLFEFSVEEFRSYGWVISELTDDLHANGPVGIMTGYEEKFWQLGTPIHRLVARPTVRPAEKPVRKDLPFILADKESRKESPE